MPNEQMTCVACGREATRRLPLRLEQIIREGIALVVCVNPTECRAYWPREAA